MQAKQTHLFSILLSLLASLLFAITAEVWAGDIDTKFDQVGTIRYKTYSSGGGYKSYLLDNCYKYGQDCGTNKAADAWCREYMGFQGGAVSNGGVTSLLSGDKTLTIGDNQECSASYCGIYQSVTCTTANPTKFDNPKFRGFRLDTTEKSSGGLTDASVADMYCKSFGFGGVFTSASIGNAGEPTKRFGDDTTCSSNCGAFAYITCGTFKITAPSTNKVLEAGDSVTINWVSDKVGSIKLELYKGGAFYKTIATGVTDTGTYSWTVDASLTEGTDYSIKVSETSGKFLHDAVGVKIAKPGIKISLPTGGETYYRGKDAIQVNWLSGASIGHVSIQLVTEAGSVARTIVGQTLAKNGSKSWDIPADVATGRYKIRVKDYPNGTIVTDSGVFTISRLLHSLNVVLNNQNGSVKDSKGRINCPQSACQTTAYEYGESVSLTATPATGHTFSGFSGCTASGNSCSFTLDADKTVNANFSSAASYKLTATVSREGTASGTVKSDPAGIVDCNWSQGTCSATFAAGTVNLIATPDANSDTFFIGCSQVSGNTCTVNLASDKNIGVSFQPKATSSSDFKLEFDPFPQRNVYLISELTQEADGLQIRLRVKSAPAQIQRVDLDWTGTGKTTACRPEDGSASIEVNERLVCSSKDLGSNPFINGSIYTMTSTAYDVSNNKSNMLKFRYKAVTTSDADKYTGTQNPNHMEKFWVIDPNTDKKGFFVDTARGTQVLQLNFLHQLGIVGLDFSLQYNSGFGKTTAFNPLGKGWNHNYGMMARLDLSKVSQNEITVKWSDNRKLVLTKEGSEYRDATTEEEGRLSGQYDKLIKDTDGTYLLTKKDKSKYRFDAAGKLTFVKNKYQQALALEYSGDKLSKIREIDSANKDTGIYLAYEYDSYGQIQFVKDSTRQVALYYQDSCLMAVVDPEGIEHKFEYQAGTCLMTKYYRNKNGTVTLFKNNVYDSATGALTSQQDGKGQTTSFSYDESKPGLIKATITSPSNYQTVDTYNTNYQLIDHVLKDGSSTYQTQYSYTQAGMLRRKREAPQTSLERVTEYDYDQNGNTTKITYADGNFVEREYDEQNNLKKETNEQKIATTYTYNSNNTLDTKTFYYGENDKAQISYTYNNDGQVATVTQPGNKKTTTTYTSGRAATVTDPEGSITAIGYDAAGNIKKTVLKDSTGAIVKVNEFDYDKLGRETLQRTFYNTSPLVLTTTYSLCGGVDTVTDAKNSISRQHYDGNCNLTSVEEPGGKVTQYEYDAEDRKTATIDANNHKQGVTYNALGLVTEEWAYDGATKKLLASHVYDVLGNRTASYQETDDAGNARFKLSSAQYDGRDRVTLQTDAHHKTVYLYGSYGRLANIKEYDDCNTDDASVCSESYRTTSFTYFADNKLATVTDAEQGKASQAFDGRGNRTELKDPKSNATGFDYDGNNKENKQTPAAGSAATRKYNAMQLLEWVRNGRGQEERYTYYDNGWLKTITLEGKTWNYSYDANGNIEQVSGPDGTLVRTYDSLNRVTSYKDTLGNTVSYDYYPNDQIKAIRFDGHSIGYTYNTLGRLSTVSWDGAQIVAYAYTRQGKLKSEMRSNGTIREYEYTKDRLTGIVDKKATNNEVIVSFGLAYNDIGDITQETINPEPTLDQLKIPAVSMTYQADNRLKTYNGQLVEFDADGNMTKGPLGDTFATFSYDTRNRLISAGNTQYTYTIENHRTKVTDNGQTTEYLVNPHAALSQVLFKKGSDGSKTYFIYGDGLVAQVVQNQINYYHFDLRGSTVALTNYNGVITDRITYMPYGIITNRLGSTKTPFLFIGKSGVSKDVNGLFNMRARYYSASINRFLSKDVVLGEMVNPASTNRYSYAFSSPILLIDPVGYWPSLAGIRNGFVSFSEAVVESTIVNPVKYAGGAFMAASNSSAYIMAKAIGEDELADEFIERTASNFEMVSDNTVDTLLAVGGFGLAKGAAAVNYSRPIVIGENMSARVIPASKGLELSAAALGQKPIIYKGLPGYGYLKKVSGKIISKESKQKISVWHNNLWLKMRAKYFDAPVYDVGIDPLRQSRSINYLEEKKLLKEIGKDTIPLY